MCRINLYIRITLLTGLLLAVFCSTDSISGGTSTSENGKILGQIVTTSGSPASHVIITLIPVNYDPVIDSDIIPVDTTDVYGNYSFTNVAKGIYNIQSVHIDCRWRGLRNNIQISNDAIRLPSDTLHNPGSIRIMLPETVTGSGHVYIPGTTIFASVDSSIKHIILDSVPAGTIQSIVYLSNVTTKKSILRYAIPVYPQDTANVTNTLWKYNNQILLNTSVSGANIGETVYDFPVLIRLTKDNFNFNEAQSNGKDIIFTKQDNTILPCEIERWDAINRVAEIWVKIDTLEGNSTDNEISMYWGNSQFPAVLNNAPVFDTANGYCSVWHLNEDIDTVRDATANGFNGLRHGNVRKSEGIIGFGQTIIDSGAYFDVGDVLNPGFGNFTVSIWVKRANTGLQTIIAKSSGGSPSSSYGWTLSFGLNNEVHCFTASNGSDWGESGVFDFWSKDEIVTDFTSWHHVAAVMNRSNSRNSRIYLDGIDVTNGSNGDVTSLGFLVNSISLRIGAEGDGDYPWTGSFDECIISDTVRSEAWLRLCFINQKPDNRLVQFR